VNWTRRQSVNTDTTTLATIGMKKRTSRHDYLSFFRVKPAPETKRNRYIAGYQRKLGMVSGAEILGTDSNSSKNFKKYQKF